MLQAASPKSRRGITIKALKGFVKAKARVAPQTIFSNVSSHPPTPLSMKEMPSPLWHVSSYKMQARSSQVNKKASKKHIQIICLLRNSNHLPSQCINFEAKSLNGGSNLHTPKTSASIVSSMAILLFPAPRQVFVTWLDVREFIWAIFIPTMHLLQLGWIVHLSGPTPQVNPATKHWMAEKRR